MVQVQEGRNARIEPQYIRERTSWPACWDTKAEQTSLLLPELLSAWQYFAVHEHLLFNGAVWPVHTALFSLNAAATVCTSATGESEIVWLVTCTMPKSCSLCPRVIQINGTRPQQILSVINRF